MSNKSIVIQLNQYLHKSLKGMLEIAKEYIDRYFDPKYEAQIISNSISHFACRGKGCNSLILTYQNDPIKLCDRCMLRQDEHDMREKRNNYDNFKPENVNIDELIEETKSSE